MDYYVGGEICQSKKKLNRLLQRKCRAYHLIISSCWESMFGAIVGRPAINRTQRKTGEGRKSCPFGIHLRTAAELSGKVLRTQENVQFTVEVEMSEFPWQTTKRPKGSENRVVRTDRVHAAGKPAR